MHLFRYVTMLSRRSVCYEPDLCLSCKKLCRGLNKQGATSKGVAGAWLPLVPPLMSFDTHLLWRASITSTMQLAMPKTTRHIRSTIHLARREALLAAGCIAVCVGEVLMGSNPSERLRCSSREDRVLLAGDACRAVLMPTLGLEEPSVMPPSVTRAAVPPQKVSRPHLAASCPCRVSSKRC